MLEPLTDGEIAIRPYAPEDAEALFEAARESIDHISQWLPWCHPGYSLEEAREWASSRRDAWNAGIDYSFVIMEARSGRFLGGVGLNQINTLNRFANLGYWVRVGETGRGVATAATRLTARFGFEALGLVRVEILAAVDNHASRRVAAKSGAQAEGILRRRLLIDGVSHDAVMHSLLWEEVFDAPPSA